MQTFLNEPTFKLIAKQLDPLRLRKQFIEARQIMDVLLEKPESRWRNHPAVKQWVGYEVALYNYSMEIGWEIKCRGWKYEKNLEALELHYVNHLQDRELVYPKWWLNPELSARIIRTHRTRLFVKDPVFYKDYESTRSEEDLCCSRCNYFWPSHHYKNIGVIA